MRAKDTPDIINNRYYKFAVEITKLMLDRFPYGALNQVETVKLLKIDEEDLKKHLGVLHSIGVSLDTNAPVIETANIIKDLQWANCGIFTNYAIGMVKNRYPEIFIESVFFNDHEMLVFGRDANSDPQNITTWGNEALLCDIWAKYTIQDANHITALDIAKEKYNPLDLKNLGFQTDNLDMNLDQDHLAYGPS